MKVAGFQCNNGGKARYKVRNKFEMLFSSHPSPWNVWFVPIILSQKGEKFCRL